MVWQSASVVEGYVHLFVPLCGYVCVRAMQDCSNSSAATVTGRHYRVTLTGTGVQADMQSQLSVRGSQSTLQAESKLKRITILFNEGQPHSTRYSAHVSACVYYASCASAYVPNWFVLVSYHILHECSKLGWTFPGLSWSAPLLTVLSTLCMYACICMCVCARACVCVCVLRRTFPPSKIHQVRCRVHPHACSQVARCAVGAFIREPPPQQTYQPPSHTLRHASRHSSTLSHSTPWQIWR